MSYSGPTLVPGMLLCGGRSLEYPLKGRHCTENAMSEDVQQTHGQPLQSAAGFGHACRDSSPIGPVRC